MSYLSRLIADAKKGLEDEPSKAAKAPFAPFDGDPNSRFHGLPPCLANGLSALLVASCPKGLKAQAWLEAVADALRLADEGWAAKALALGWLSLDLFGAVVDPQGDPGADGLAVKLSGRRMLAICEGFATVADANGGRSYLYRGDTNDTRLLWELGR